MDIEGLNLLMRIARLASISAAARDLGITPATASARLAALEGKLDTRLLHRTTRMATLTEDGRAFLPYAEQVIDTAAAAMSVLGGGQMSPSGTLRIAAPSSFARMHIVRGLSDFMALSRSQARHAHLRQRRRSGRRRVRRGRPLCGPRRLFLRGASAGARPPCPRGIARISRPVRPSGDPGRPRRACLPRRGDA